MNDKYNYVIFHKGCLDGFSGFFILHTTNKIDEEAQIYPDVPSANVPPPNIDNKNIIIIDVAYKYDVLKQIVERAKTITFIDHHVTIHDDVLKIKKYTDKNKTKNVIIIYDDLKCGASLTWEYFYPNKKIPLFIRYVEDNDIGAWKMKYTHYFKSALEVKYNFALTPDNLNKWYNMFDKKHIKVLIKKGKVYHEYINNVLDFNYKRYSLELFPSPLIYEKYTDYFDKVGQYKVAVYCGSGCPSPSLLSLKMLDKISCDFIIMWVYHMDRKEYVLSFRSKHADVGTIAKIFNGGGHKLASACSFSSNLFNIQDLFFSKSLPRH